MECIVLNTRGMLSGEVAKSGSKGKLWKIFGWSCMEVLKYFSNSWSCNYRAAIILDICRGFTKIPKPVISQRSQSKKRPLEPHWAKSPLCSENIHFTMLKRGYEAACDRYQQHKPELFRVSKTPENLCTATVFIYKGSEWGASLEVLKTASYIRIEIMSFIY